MMKIKKQKSPTLSEVDQHCLTAGRLLNNAALCDIITFSAFKIISKCENKIAHAIYFSSETFNAKKSIIRRILDVHKNKIESELVNRIITATEKANTQRNELSHVLLMVSQDGQKILSRNPRHQHDAHKPVTGPYLDSLLKQSSLAHIEAMQAFQELCQLHGIPPLISLE